MSTGSNRRYRVAQEMQKKIALILQHKIKDPRIDMMTTVSYVKVSRDLAYAKVFVTFLNKKNEEMINEKMIKTTMEVLHGASGFIRFLLGKTMCLRVIPKLNFFYDNSLTEGIRISSLITIRSV